MGACMFDFSVYTPLVALVLWLVAAILWLGMTHILLRENKQIKNDTPTHLTLNYLIIRLERQQRRMLQLWGWLSLLFVGLAAIALLTVLYPAEPIRIHIATTTQPITASRPASETKSQEAIPSISQVPTKSALPYSDITEFNEKDSKQQAMIDWLKQRYENWLITYYYLQKCNLADKNDFDLIRHSLHKELTDLHTETASVEDNILLAANGSYNELYASASCDDERLKATKTSYDDYMKPFRSAPVQQPH